MNESKQMIEVDNFEIEDLGIQEEWVYDIEVEDNHNFFANNICVHNSCYMSLEPVIKKKFGENYEEITDKKRLEEFTLNYINKVAMPLVRDKIDNVLAYTLNSLQPDKLTEDPEVICDCLPENAKVQTKEGLKAIKDITIVDEVLSYNHKTKEQEYKDVTNTRKIKTNKKMLTLFNGEHTIKCTEDHRIYTKNRGYIYAKDIKEDDDLLLYK